MKHKLTEDQVASYNENGFLVIDGFLNGEELERWRRVTEEAVALRVGSDTLNNQSDPDAFYAQVFTQCLRLADIHKEMRELVYDARIGKIVGVDELVDVVPTVQNRKVPTLPSPLEDDLHDPQSTMPHDRTRADDAHIEALLDVLMTVVLRGELRLSVIF